MVNKTSQSQLKSLRDDLLKEGLINEQFLKLEELQGENEPNFVEEMLNMFFDDPYGINEIGLLLETSLSKSNELNRILCKLLGSSSTIGAAKVKHEIEQMRKCYKQGDSEGCRRAYQQMLVEYQTLKERLVPYLQMARQMEPHDAKQERDLKREV